MAEILPLNAGRFQFFDKGKPVSCGLVFTYENGTSTPATTYQDAAGTIINENPIRLDENGQAIIFGDQVYTLIVVDRCGNQLSIIDDVGYLWPTPATITRLHIADLP